MKKSILHLGKAIGKMEQKSIKGGEELEPACIGTGTGGVGSTGFSQACVGQPRGTQCIIDGYLAACTGNGGGFWYY